MCVLLTELKEHKIQSGLQSWLPLTSEVSPSKNPEHFLGQDSSYPACNVMWEFI